jgi:hypothetical protein
MFGLHVLPFKFTELACKTVVYKNKLKCTNKIKRGVNNIIIEIHDISADHAKYNLLIISPTSLFIQIPNFEITKFVIHQLLFFLNI